VSEPVDLADDMTPERLSELAAFSVRRGQGTPLLAGFAELVAEVRRCRAAVASLTQDRDTLRAKLTEAEAVIVNAQDALTPDHDVFWVLDDYDGSMDSVRTLTSERDAAREQAAQAQAGVERIAGVAKALRITVAEMLSGKQHTQARTMTWQSTLKYATEALATSAPQPKDTAPTRRCSCNSSAPWCETHDCCLWDCWDFTTDQHKPAAAVPSSGSCLGAPFCSRACCGPKAEASGGQDPAADERCATSSVVPHGKAVTRDRNGLPRCTMCAEVMRLTEPAAPSAGGVTTDDELHRAHPGQSCPHV
jgi:hypothetical protein